MPPALMEEVHGEANGDGPHQEVPEQDPFGRAGYKILVSPFWKRLDGTGLTVSGYYCRVRSRHRVMVELGGRGGRADGGLSISAADTCSPYIQGIMSMEADTVVVQIPVI